MKSYVFGIKILEYIICIKLIGIYMNNVNEVIYINNMYNNDRNAKYI